MLQQQILQYNQIQVDMATLSSSVMEMKLNWRSVL